MLRQDLDGDFALQTRNFHHFRRRHGNECFLAVSSHPAIVKTRDNDVVPILPRGLVDQRKIQAGVKRAERALQPDVKRILFTFTSDWTGDPSLFFRIVISDAAAAPNRLREGTQRIGRIILTEIKADDLGLQTYFNFRSQSEQAKLREPTWEP